MKFNRIRTVNIIRSTLKTPDTLIFIFLSVIFFVSFRSFSLICSSFAQSDDAVHVMMAYDLKLPDDLYYWGQNRLGSLSPIISHFLLKLTGFSAAQSISFTQYFFLFLGFLAYNTFLRKKLSSIILALIWFLPCAPFIDLVNAAQPYGVQLTTFGISLALANNLLHKKLTGFKKHLFLSTSIFSLFISIWISDLTLLFVFSGSICFFILLIPRLIYKNQAGFSTENLIERLNIRYFISEASQYLVNTLICLSLGTTSLIFLKANFPPDSLTASYLKVNDFTSFLDGLKIVFSNVSSVFTFQNYNFFLSFYSILIVGTLVAVIYIFCSRKYFFRTPLDVLRRLFKSTSCGKPLAIYFLINASLCFLIAISSKWVYMNKMFPRYFVPTYFFLWMFTLVWTENLQKKQFNRMISILLAISLLGSLSLPSYVFSLKKPESTIQRFHPMQSLGEVGFIGSYWNSYVICMVNPKIFSCTPHDGDYVRCIRCKDNVMRSPKIYLIKDSWLDSFPEKIEQFGQPMVKSGEAKYISGLTLAPYKIIPKSFSQEISILRPLEDTKTNSQIKVLLLVENTSNFSWKNNPQAQPVNLSYHWLDSNGKTAVFEGARTSLPFTLAPGESAALTALVHTPSQPGKYTLVLTMVQEQVAWFIEKQARATEIEIEVRS